MAKNPSYEVKSLHARPVVLAGRFAGATGAPTKTAGLGFTVTSSGTGLFTVTPSRFNGTVVSAVATVQDAVDADPLIARVDAINSTTGAVTFAIVDADGTAALEDVDAVHFVLVIQDSTLPSV